MIPRTTSTVKDVSRAVNSLDKFRQNRTKSKIMALILNEPKSLIDQEIDMIIMYQLREMLKEIKEGERLTS